MMIEHGNMVFKGSIEEFNNYMDPSVLLVIMHNAPVDDSEFMSIEGMERVEKLTKTRFRLHFKGDNDIVGRVVKKAVSNNWHLREISLEKESLDKWINIDENNNENNEDRAKSFVLLPNSLDGVDRVCIPIRIGIL